MSIDEDKLDDIIFMAYPDLYKQFRENIVKAIYAYVIREREISCLEARMEEEMVYGGSKKYERIPELSKKIAELKGL